MAVSQTWWEELGLYQDMSSDAYIIDDVQWELSNCLRQCLIARVLSLLGSSKPLQRQNFFFFFEEKIDPYE